MNTSCHEMGLDSVDGLAAIEAVCLFVAEDERPLPGLAGFLDWRLCGALSRILRQGFFVGAAKDCLLLPTGGRVPMERAFAVGMGASEQLSAERLSELLAETGAVLKKAKVEAVALEVPGAGRVDDEARASAILNNFVPAFGGRRLALLAEKGFSRFLSSTEKRSH
jgi:hypothetical protein